MDHNPDRICVWPGYFDTRSSRRSGRRVPKDSSVIKPGIEGLFLASRKLGLKKIKRDEGVSHPLAPISKKEECGSLVQVPNNRSALIRKKNSSNSLAPSGVKCNVNKRMHRMNALPKDLKQETEELVHNEKPKRKTRLQASQVSRNVPVSRSDESSWDFVQPSEDIFFSLILNADKVIV